MDGTAFAEARCELRVAVVRELDNFDLADLVSDTPTPDPSAVLPEAATAALFLADVDCSARGDASRVDDFALAVVCSCFPGACFALLAGAQVAAREVFVPVAVFWGTGLSPAAL